MPAFVKAPRGCWDCGAEVLVESGGVSENTERPRA